MAKSMLRRIVAAIRGEPAKRGQRMYAAARGSRLTGGFGISGDSSADTELSSSLTRLRSTSRQMIRDSAYAKRAKTVVVNNVVGPGVGMQAQVMTTRGGMSPINASIEEAWCEWCCADSAHTGGALHFHDLERALMGQVFEAGEVFVRKHFARFGDSRIPLSLELVEAERVPADIATPGVSSAQEVRMGIERDSFGRALAYWIRERHPGDIRQTGPQTERYERVPAENIIHLRLVDRWPQTRGEPWLHTSARKLNDMNEYSAAEVQAARMSSMFFGTIETDKDDSLPTDEEDDGTQVMDIQAGLIQQLAPGEKLNFHNPNRPNTALDPFMRYMLREVAAGCGVSYESLSRDYSQSNYSSSRLALLDDRDLWRMLQQWWIRNFRMPLHKVWLRQAVYSQAVPAVSVESYALDPRRFEAVLFKPRGWSWIDPTKEVNAYKEAIKAGLTTLTDVIAQTADGRDIEDVIATRKRELELMAEADIATDTDVAAEREAKEPPEPPAGPEPDDGEGDTPDMKPARVVAIKGKA